MFVMWSLYGVFTATLGVSLRASISISGSPVIIIINAGSSDGAGSKCCICARKIYTNDNRRAAIFFFLFVAIRDPDTNSASLLYWEWVGVVRHARSPEKRENYSALGAEEFTAAAAISFLNIFGRAHTLRASRVCKVAVLSSGQHRFFDLLIEIVLKDTSLFFSILHPPVCNSHQLLYILWECVPFHSYRDTIYRLMCRNGNYKIILFIGVFSDKHKQLR